MTTSAFAPAHVSGLFAVHDEHPDPLRKGSRGAGWSLDLGATATARPAAMAGHGRLTLGGKPVAPTDLPVTRAALSELGRAEGLDIDLRLGLPVGQGFGMSAAGSLAACLAATAELGLEPEAALAATHRAEVGSGTGLGDAIGSWVGAAEVRVAPGIPPHGGATRIDVGAAPFLFLVMGQGIATPRIIRDEAWGRRTREHGDAAVDRILAAGRPDAWRTILGEAHAFSQALGLMPPAMTQLGTTLPAGCAWGQAMLGTTMWVTGPSGPLAEARETLAGTLAGVADSRLVEARVDGNGARLVRSG